MPTPTYTPLATVTLGASASSVTFSSIPATYRDLILIITGTVASSGNLSIRLNGDTGSNYSYVFAGGDGSSATSSSATEPYMNMARLETGQGTNKIDFMDYSATDKHTTALVRRTAPASATLMAAQRWANTAAVTSIVIAPIAATTFNSGCTFNLFGVIA
jgi:hypothetical protein